MDRQEFKELIEGKYDYKQPKRGDLIEATVMSAGQHEIHVDLGAKRSGIVQARDLSMVEASIVDAIQDGDEIPVVVLRTLGVDGSIPVSLRQGLESEDWLRARRMQESGEIVEAQVIGVNRGGALVAFGPLEGFVPNSHISCLRRSMSEESCDAAKEALVGERLPLVVLEAERRRGGRGRLVLSQRGAQRHQREAFIESLSVGQILTGIVHNVVSYGAFVDLGPVDGLVHVSELAWHYAERPADVVSVGDEIDVQVLNVDVDRQRIGLSRKRALPDPWEQVTDKLRVGDLVEGTLTSVAEFGVFVDLGGVEGLVHRSEIAGWPDSVPSDAVGNPMTVTVKQVDTVRRRISLRPADLLLDIPGAPTEPEAEEEDVSDLLGSIAQQLDRIGL